MTSWAEIGERIAAADAPGVVAALARLDEVERRALAPDAVARSRADHLDIAAGLAVLATGRRADAERIWPGVLMREPALCVQALSDRRPPWLEAWVSAMCERNPAAAWPTARALRRQGLYSGDSPAYALAFIAGVGGDANERLREDPDLLRDELWRGFQIEGGGETSFAAHDKYTLPELSWSAALRRLAAEGLVDRGRLLDATLDALARGYSAFRAGWFVRFHDELAPSDDERLARVDSYLGLLGSPTAQVQSFAVGAVAAVDRLRPLPAAQLFQALRPAVLNRTKRTAMQALRLVEDAAQREPATAGAGALLAVEALLHEAPEVQGRALAAVERYGSATDGDLKAAVEAAAPLVAPSVLGRLQALVGAGTQRPAVQSSATPAPPTPPADVLEAAVLATEARVEPIHSVADLALAVARVLEHPEEPDEVERTLDAISRLGAAADAEPAAVWKPIRKRCARYLRDRAPFEGKGVGVDVAGLVAAWLDADPPAPTVPPKTVLGFFSARTSELARRIAAGRAQPLLSAPTHQGGWIDPRTLVARLGEGRPADTADLVLALLRLAPDGRAAALESATELAGEAGAALRFALGGDGETVGPTEAVWVAAARARCPGRDAPPLGRRLHGLGAGAERVARPRITIERHATSSHAWHQMVVAVDAAGDPPSALFPTVALHGATRARERYGYPWSLLGARGWGTGAATEADVRWCATLQPADLDPFFLDGLERIANNLDWWEAHWEDRAFLEPLLTLPTSFSDPAVRLLTAALGAKEPGTRGLAADVTSVALGDGRLPARRLGAALAEAWGCALYTPRRFALALGAAAETSERHRSLVREALALAFRTRPHTDAAQLLELLHELCHAEAVGVRDAEARATLAGYTSGKAGRLAQSVLAL